MSALTAGNHLHGGDAESGVFIVLSKRTEENFRFIANEGVSTLCWSDFGDRAVVKRVKLPLVRYRARQLHLRRV